jgi:hypothetical protein
VDFVQLRELASGIGYLVDEPATIEGVVISDCNSMNMELNPTINYYTVDTSVNDRTAYIQSADGRYGFRLQFDKVADNTLKRYDHVVLDLYNAIISVETDPDRYTIGGLSAASIKSARPGKASDLPAKQKFISELTDDDIYTFVTLRDMEFIFKSGSYTNIWEPYAQKSVLNDHPDINASQRMDGWATLAGDATGDAIYLLVNTRCTWRRTGSGLPQGMGPVGGIIVHTPMRRYGGDMGRYSIRPVDDKDIKVSNKRKDAPLKTLVEWSYNYNPAAELDFEFAGKTAGVKTPKYKGDRVLAETGKGFLWTNSGAYIMLTADYNNPSVREGEKTDSKGWVSNAALRFDANVADWYVWDEQDKVSGTNSILVEFPTLGISGNVMSFNFEFGAGLQSGDTSWNYPAYWCVEYSVDGGDTFVPVRNTVTGKELVILRAIPWWDTKIKNSGSQAIYRTGYDTAMGYTSHTFGLPAECFGKPSVIVALSPASANLAWIRSNPADNVIAKGFVKKTMVHNTNIRFGEISVRYR